MEIIDQQKQILKHTALLACLRKNKDAQKAASNLRTNRDFLVIRDFIADVKSFLAEHSFNEDNIEVIRRYRHVVAGLEAVALLPEFADMIRNEESEKKEKLRRAEEDKKRRRYNPGQMIHRIRQKAAQVITP